jgi:4-amino-4-deoxy-L-arabinose transferase-like glycosyltransferase
MNSSPRVRFLLLCALAVLPRLAFVILYGPSAPPTSWGDDWHYDRIARQLLSERVYTDGWFPPGYPLLLTAIYAIFGAHVAAVRFVQVSLGAATCGMVYLLGRRLYDERAGIVGAVLLAFYPPHLYFTWRLMAETAFACVLAVSAWLTIELVDEPRWWRGLALGLTLGLGSLLKSNLIILPPLLLLWLVVTLRRRSPVKVLVTVAVPFVLLLEVVPLANFAAGRGLSAPLPLNTGHTLWWANNPKSNGYFVMADADPEVRTFIREAGLADALTTSSRAEKDRIYQHLAVTWMRAHPVAFLRLAPRKLLNAFSPMPMAAVLESNGSAAIIYAVVYGLLLPFAAYGFAASLRHPTPSARVIHLILLSYAVMVVIFYGTPRFTLIVIPFFTVFAGHAVASAASWLPAIESGKAFAFGIRVPMLTNSEGRR